ncbi:acyl-CoA Delta-9 desaturase [Rhodnius prolixus]
MPPLLKADKKECDVLRPLSEEIKELSPEQKVPYVSRIRWPDLFAQIFIHAGAFYGLFLVFTSAQWATTLWTFFMIYSSGLGITAGAHRLWSHKSYKAKWPLRLLLAFLFTISGQRHIYVWALDHRVHHKYSETDADPHDARRGFWFSHVGWLFLTPHPEVVIKRAAVDMSDLDRDPIVVWQRRLYIPLFALLCVALPVWVPYYFWNETLVNSYFLAFHVRFATTLNIAYSVNSFAHMYGNKPYDKNIMPTESIGVAIGALGEGWHNYHHVFPWDYKTSEFGSYKMNLTTGFIDLCARYKLATERKSASKEMVKRRALRTGDGSWHPGLWGYGDTDQPQEEIDEIEEKSL